MKKIIIGVVIILLLFSVGYFLKDKYYFDDTDPVMKKGDMIWAGHTFRVASGGEVEFLDNGYRVNSKSRATSKLVDINMNQKIKVNIIADIKGEHISGEFTEFAIYISEKEDSFFDNKAGIALMGSRDNTKHSDAPRAGENIRKSFNFEWFSVENTEDSIIFEDSSGRLIEETKNSDKRDSSRVFQDLDQNKEWNIRINSDVKGEGFTELKIKEIIVKENLY